MAYKFKYRRKWFWHSIKVAGHKYDPAQDKIILYLENGAIREIKDWKNCEVNLDTDWVLAVQKQMEEQAGTSIPIKVVQG